MRSRSVGRAMSTYLGRRHVPPAVVVSFLGSQQVNKLSQGVSKARKKQSLPVEDVKDTRTSIRIGQKTYTLKVEDDSQIEKSPKKVRVGRMKPISNPAFAPTLEGWTNDTDDNTDVILSMKECVLQSLSNLPKLISEKPFLAPADKISKMESKIVSNSPPYIAFAKEMLSSKKLMSGHHFKLEKDLVHEGENLNRLFRQYLQSGDDKLSTMHSLENHWKSLKPVLGDLTNAQCFDSKATHPLLRYCQGFECIANYKGTPSIICVRKINRYQQKIHRLKLVACAAAFNSDPQWPVQVENFVLILPKIDGSPAIVNVFNKENTSDIWEECLLRIEQFWKDPYTVVIIKERLSAPKIEPESSKSSSNLEQISNKTDNGFVLICEDQSQTIEVDLPKSTSVEMDEIPLKSSASSNEAKLPNNTDPENERSAGLNKDEEEKKVFQSFEQANVKKTKDEMPKPVNETTTQCTAQTKQKEGVLTSLWNYWKSK